MISGKINGSKIKPIVTFCPKNLYLEAALAVRVPNIVANAEDNTAIISEFNNASWRVSSSSNWPNHLVEKPESGKEITWLELKENIGSNSAGA